jgi:fermentation-respiration switch protein FrsA (DUF1100 family)
MIGLFLLAAVLFISRLCYKIAFYSVNNKEQDIYVIPPGKQYEAVADTILSVIKEVDALPFELVSTKAMDGTILVGRYYHFYDDAPLQILFHGYRGCGIREFAGNNRLAKELGFNALVVDERAHGKSGGHTITFGIKERYDCQTWAEYAVRRFGKGTTIFLSGVSMGAASVLMASSLNLPANVKAITADCPFSSPGAIIRKVSRDIRLPQWLSYPFVVLGALVFGRFRIWQSSALKSVQNTRIPILLIHGEDDLFVPCNMSREIYAACAGPAELVVVPEAGHGLSYFTDTALYTSSMEDFLRLFGVLS